MQLLETASTCQLTLHRQSCITEAQKTEGAFYREKKSKKSTHLPPTDWQAPQKAYVEDASDPDTGNTVSIVAPPPEAPAPPPAVPAVNVFDFLVPEETPSKSMAYTPSIIGSEIGRKQTITETDPEYDRSGVSYGRDPIPSTRRKERPRVEYITPSGKDLHSDLTTKSSDMKKRKRHHVENLDLSTTRRDSSEDAPMSDAPPPPPPRHSQQQQRVLHSGLTGGLNRLLSKSAFSPSLDDSNDPPSPVKRSRPGSSSMSQSLIVKERDRSDRRAPPAPTLTSTALTKPAHRRESDESKPRRKKHRSSHHHHHYDDDPNTSRHHHKERKPQKTIEHPASSKGQNGESQQLIPYRSRADLFMSFVNKGEESERGMSVHKALKRYHRERGGGGRAMMRTADKGEEEKELWKGLRLRRNERGEVVLFLE